MRDRDIRKALKAQVLRNDLKDPNTVVIDELGLRHGKSRVDVGIINGAISGLEIKRVPMTIFVGCLDRLLFSTPSWIT